MATAPRVAAVLPAYDSAATLPAAIASVQAQTLAVHRLIVVDDGSRDQGAARAEDLGAEVLRRENGGPAAARNTGIAAVADCDWIAFLDADDLWEPDHLDRQLAAVTAEDEAIGCDAWVTAADGRSDRQHKNGPGTVRTELGLEDLLRRNPLTTSGMVVRRDAILAVGGFDEDRILIATEDYDLWLRLAARRPIRYLDQPLVRYRRTGDSLADNERFVPGIDRIMAKLGDRHPGDRKLEQMADGYRARARVHLAYDRLGQGRRRDARALLREARDLDPRCPGLLRTLLRSYLPW